MDGKIDFGAGVSLATLEEGKPLLGYVGDQPVFLLRTGSSMSAFGATCSHLGGLLQEGLVDGWRAICPWHHACFDLRDGKALSAPAFNPLERYEIDLGDDKVFVSREKARPAVSRVAAGNAGTIAIVGGGAAGFAAAHTLREGNWRGRIVMYSADADPPYDRTLLTKDYLDGNFGDDRIEIARGRLEHLSVELMLHTPVKEIDPGARTLRLDGGRRESYGTLLLATGATPKSLAIPGAAQPNVLPLRTLADCRRLLAAATSARRIAVIGSSFIGLEAAASLKSRGLEVTVIAPQRHPMEERLGRHLSNLIVETLESHGVEFHLGRKPARLDGRKLTLDDGTSLETDVVLVGIGVAPNVELAQASGISVDDGVIVDEELRSSEAGIYAAGDIANYPDPISGERIRIEHWVVAQRQGQAAAENMLGARRPFTSVPFFWAKFFDLSFRYVGHADDWDEIATDGDLARRQAVIHYRKNGRDLAVATLGRDRDALLAERAFQLRVS